MRHSCSKVYLVAFWMRKFGHPSLKRSLVLSNAKQICRLDRGRLTKKERATAAGSAKTYVDGRGRKRYQGTKALKNTQILA